MLRHLLTACCTLLPALGVSPTAELPLTELRLPTRCDFSIVLSEATPEQESAFCAGFQALLLGQQEAARAYFECAIERGIPSPLARVGLILANTGLGQNQAQQQRLQEAKNLLASLQLDTILSPQEAHYLDAFSLLLAGKRAQAAESFANYASKFRADEGLALWAIQLLHDQYGRDGSPSSSQARAIELADALLERNPENALAHYLRALIEENAPSISEQALASARKAEAQLAAEPMPKHLLGHLLNLKGEQKAALAAFKEAEEAASAWQRANDLHWRENSSWVRSRLYHITLLHQIGQISEAKRLLEDTLKRRLPLSAKYAQENPTAAELLYHWELRSLEARLLLSRGEGMSHKTHQNLLKQGTNSKWAHPEYYEGYSNYQRCLYECLEARLYQKEGKKLQAQAALGNATALREDLQKKWSAIHNYTVQSCVLRAGEACDRGMNLVRCEIFETTRELWLDKLQEESRASSLLMPPIVPLRGDEQK